MKKRILVIVTMVLAIMLAVVSASAEWIKTENGKPANAREWPDSDSTLLARIPYGTAIKVVGSSVNGYTPIVLASGSDQAYVLTRFIKKSKPAPYKPDPNKKNNSSTKKTSGELQSGILSEFKAAKWVAPYDVRTIHPRSSGLINMRFAPSKKATLVESFVSGQTVTVLCQLKDWVLVQCPTDGKVGYIRHDFLQQ